MSAVTPRTFLVASILPALDLLPIGMATHEAKALMLAIALQESDLAARLQRYITADGEWKTGPAHSFYQFELGGLIGVLKHPATQRHAAKFVADLGYSDLPPPQLLGAMVHDSVLASGMARLNLFWDAHALPTRSDGPAPAWDCYLRIWRPGKPREHDWAPNWTLAWDVVA